MLLDQLLQVKDLVVASMFGPSGFGTRLLGIARHYIGVGIGYKNGDPAQGLCLRFYVRRKLLPVEIPPLHFINGFLWGVPTDVVPVGTFVAYGGGPNAAPPGPRFTPGWGIRFRAGLSTGDVGTLGAVLADDRGNRYALSANHVLARNGGPLTTPGFQIVDAGSSMATTLALSPPAIGSEVRFADLVNGGKVDCAMVMASNPTLLRQTFPSEMGTVGGAVAPPDFQRPVRKFGRTSGFTSGIVLDRFVTVEVIMPRMGKVRFDHASLISDGAPQNGIRSFASPGDSGALVVQQDGAGFAPMGLVVGGPNTDVDHDGAMEDFILICPLQEALAALQQRLPADRGALHFVPSE